MIPDRQTLDATTADRLCSGSAPPYRLRCVFPNPTRVDTWVAVASFLPRRFGRVAASPGRRLYFGCRHLPPYNLGVQYRSYDDGRPRGEYLEWTGRWVKEVTRVLAADGSLFLNVGAKPTDPWTALDVAQAAAAPAAAEPHSLDQINHDRG